ncbi:MAG: pyridoxamine 5'-phosphate oxidase family protein [Eubacteriales bacterium]
MTKQEAYNLMNSNPVLQLATVEGDQPRVRGMLLYKADEEGILFHSGTMKDVYKQIVENPKVEVSFIDQKTNTQLRVSGELEIVDDNNLKEEIANHPTRAFLKPWIESGELEDFYNVFVVFRLKNGVATTWTFADNFVYPKEKINL